jgi:hypothetical protein
MNLNSRKTVGLLCSLGLQGACGGDDGSVGIFTGGADSSPTTGPTDGDGSQGTDGSGASATNADADSASDTDPGQKFDVGSVDDLPTACTPDDVDDPACHCNSVDILFVVDNSGSMNTHRDNVKAAFDDLVGEMIEALPAGTDLHVGLTRATGFFDPGNSSSTSGCDQFTVDGQWNPPEQSNNGVNGQQGRLYEHQGQRYFAVKTDENPAPLLQWFEGALAGTIDGFVPHSNTETVVAGAAYPFAAVNAAYNDGFVRDQAVLVLFLLSDTVDMSPAHVPTQDFIDMVSDRKAACGDHCIITTGAIMGSCYSNLSVQNTRLYDFMNGFGQPPASWIDIWSPNPNFASVLGTALADVVAETCNVIPPAG